MKKFIAKVVTLGMTLMALAAISFTIAPAANAGDSPNIQICHATSSTTNPYEPVTISKTAVVKKAGHGAHSGDIIPSFTYAEKKGDPLITYPGQNWTTENQALYTNSCVKPLTVVTPIAPTYTPGTCVNPTGTVTLNDQPTGVRLAFGPKLTGEALGAAWTVSYVAEEGYKLSSEAAGVFTIPVVGPNSSDPNWDAATNGCGLPEVGAGSIEAFYPYIGGAFALGLLLILGNAIPRRRNA